MNNDLISRQAAIDAIRKEYAGIHDANMDGDFLADEIEFIITKIPSVQPQQTGLTWGILLDNIKLRHSRKLKPKPEPEKERKK